MTAEAVVMNKNAVAMAADSAVTVGGGKVFNTANKIFALSACNPVGLMVFGSAEFMGVPWETLVNLFGQRFSDKCCDTLAEYAEHFLDFIAGQADVADQQQQESFAVARVERYFGCLAREIANAVSVELDEIVEAGGAIDKKTRDDRFASVAARVIQEQLAVWREAPLLGSLAKKDEHEIGALYRPRLADTAEATFGELSLSASIKSQLGRLALLVLTRRPDGGLPDSSGIVIGGYGEAEIFPHLQIYEMVGIAAGHVLYHQVHELDADITFTNTASIVPFAQQEMVHTFMEGVDPEYQGFLEKDLRNTLDGIVQAVVEVGTFADQAEKEQFEKALSTAAGGELSRCVERLKKYRDRHQVAPVISMVASLPKDELAELAEALVALTSLKRKMSNQRETVGGPIDVAVLSKGDGFVWIKRKVYFDSRLNRPNRVL